ncbi:MAG: MFS transporter [Scytonematopsis contorta HA4267-MV1]|jgi:MFS family permease|nr:MFS transporter [Scytonematopsis contorta HA4267-MV1]
MRESKFSGQKQLSLWEPLRVRNFLLLYIGESVSLFGDQFYLIALPWLTIQITNSGVSLGTVLMAAAIPRAVLMLIGGVVSDRFSPRLVMLVSNGLRVLLTVSLATIVASGTTQLWHLYIFAISFGIVEGFFIPAAKSIVPSLVTAEQLVASNTLTQGTSQMIVLIGPSLAGLVIAISGIQAAFAIDAATFVVTTVTLLLMKGRLKPNTEMTEQLKLNEESKQALDSTVKKPTSNKKITSIFAAINEGLNYGWHSPALRTVLLILMMLNLFFIGPLQVGITGLASNRFPGGAIALGIMNSAWGGGGLLGTLMPQILQRHLPRLGVLMLILASIQGFGLFLLGFIPNIILASVTIAILGFCSSFFNIVGTIWIQKQTPPEMLGRIMSLGMLCSLGVAPISYALAGFLADLNLTILFASAGGVMLGATILLAVNPSVSRID